MFLRSFVLILFFGFAWSTSSKASTTEVILGDTTVGIEQMANGKGKAFVHVHQNETTALKAAKAVVRQHGGSVLTLHHPGGRNIDFHLHGVKYAFDPNRMFTDEGIEKTLKTQGAYSKEAHQAVKRLAKTVLAYLPPNKKIIAVHNNETYSLQDYYEGHPLQKEAAALHVPQPEGYRNFYLTTKLDEYSLLKQTGFNALLQAPSAEDDGSLSIYLKDKPYINVEAGYDALHTQIKMLESI